MSTAPARVEHPVRHDHRGALVLTLAALALVGITATVTYVLVNGSSTTSSSSTTQGSGVPASESRTVAGFGEVELAGSSNVTIRVGEKRSVRVFADDNLLGHITTKVVDDSLTIGNRPGSVSTHSPTRVEVGVPSLDVLTLSGSGTVVLTGVTGPRLAVTISGSGIVHATGSTDQLDATVSGSGQAQLSELIATAAKALVSGSGLIAVTATNVLDASVTGSGAILYQGNPGNLTTSVTGSGTIVPASGSR